MAPHPYHCLVGSRGEVAYYTGHHPPIGLFSKHEYQDAIAVSELDLMEVYRGEDIHMGIVPRVYSSHLESLTILTSTVPIHQKKDSSVGERGL